MTSFLGKLRQPEYVHVLLNHLPLAGLFAALLCLLGALAIRQRGALFLGLVLVALFSLSVWPASEYGEKGYDRVYSMADRAGDAWLRHHRELADRWGWVYYAAAVAAAVAIVLSWKRPESARPAAIAVAVLAAAALFAGACIAESGGNIRHDEFRSGPPPPE